MPSCAGEPRAVGASCTSTAAIRPTTAAFTTSRCVGRRDARASARRRRRRAEQEGRQEDRDRRDGGASTPASR
jgi:hypothetical protein